MQFHCLAATSLHEDQMKLPAASSGVSFKNEGTYSPQAAGN
jgi:hypothetical protein